MSHSFTFEIYQESEHLKAPPLKLSGFYFQRCYNATSFLLRRMTKNPDRQKQTDKGFWKPKNPAMSGNRQFVALQRLHHNTVLSSLRSGRFHSLGSSGKSAQVTRGHGVKRSPHTHTQVRSGKDSGERTEETFPQISPLALFSFPVLVRHLVYQAGKYITKNARLKWGNYKLSDPNTICRYILVTYVQVCTQLQNLPFFVNQRKIPKSKFWRFFAVHCHVNDQVASQLRIFPNLRNLRKSQARRFFALLTIFW